MLRLACLPVLLVALVGCNPANPAANHEGLSWTHKELLEHLRAKGLQVEMRPVGVIDGEPVAAFVGNTGGPDESQTVVYLKASSRVAAEAAGPWGDAAFAWGRFLFQPGKVGSPDLVPDIRKALSGN